MKVLKVKYIKEYKLELLFSDRKNKIVDLEYLSHRKGIFAPLKDIEYFKQVKTDGITLVWPNGLDLCPDVLYENGKEFQSRKPPQTKASPKRRKRNSGNSLLAK